MNVNNWTPISEFDLCKDYEGHIIFRCVNEERVVCVEMIYYDGFRSNETGELLENITHFMIIDKI